MDSILMETLAFLSGPPTDRVQVAVKLMYCYCSALLRGYLYKKYSTRKAAPRNFDIPYMDFLGNQ
jgi:hypothetical protein